MTEIDKMELSLEAGRLAVKAASARKNKAMHKEAADPPATRMDPSLRSALIGAGIGAAGLGTAGALTSVLSPDEEKKNLFKNTAIGALLGGLGGASVGWAGNQLGLVGDTKASRIGQQLDANAQQIQQHQNSLSNAEGWGGLASGLGATANNLLTDLSSARMGDANPLTMAQNSLSRGTAAAGLLGLVDAGAAGLRAAHRIPEMRGISRLPLLGSQSHIGNWLLNRRYRGIADHLITAAGIKDGLTPPTASFVRSTPIGDLVNYMRTGAAPAGSPPGIPTRQSLLNDYRTSRGGTFWRQAPISGRSSSFPLMRRSFMYPAAFFLPSLLAGARAMYSSRDTAQQALTQAQQQRQQLQQDLIND